jgi:hypothetical protein
MSLTSYRAAPPRATKYGDAVFLRLSTDRHYALACVYLQKQKAAKRGLDVGSYGIEVCLISCCALQTWQRPTLPRLETKYHWRWSVSRPSSEWDRVQPLRCNHQVSKEQR